MPTCCLLLGYLVFLETAGLELKMAHCADTPKSSSGSQLFLFLASWHLLLLRLSMQYWSPDPPLLWERLV
jgi:hypothetical protein